MGANLTRNPTGKWKDKKMNNGDKAISILVDALTILTDSVNELKNQMILLKDKIEELKEKKACQDMTNQ